ncbi:caspase-7-like [Dysidea avara]|uniref:caspase-7-like n=1 Tax=Dysidea avara TaxID=196820 RepID=UPI003330A5BC
MIVHVKPYYVGVALLISNGYENHPDPEKRLTDSASADCREMDKLFTSFGYKVYPRRNLSKEKMIKCCECLADPQCTYPDNCKRMVVYFSGHGVSGGNVVSDINYEIVGIDKIISPVVSSRKTAGMTKMFFIDACRGSGKESTEAVRLRNDYNEPGLNAKSQSATRIDLELYENTLFAYASPPSYLSWTVQGKSHWTECLCIEFKNSREEDSVFKVLTKANNLLKEKVAKIGDGIKVLQTSEFTSSLTEAVYFRLDEKKYITDKGKYGKSVKHFASFSKSS